MRRLLLCAAALAALGLAGDAGACRNDTECPGGHRCVKGFGKKYGFCERGAGAIDWDDRVSPKDPRRPKGTLGKACQFDEDCVSGLRCEASHVPDRRVCSVP